MLSREQIEFFGENGYIKLESVYSGDELGR